MNAKKFLFDFAVRILLIYSAFFAIYKIFEITNLIYPLELIEANIVFFFVQFFAPDIYLQGNVLMNIFSVNGKTINLAIESICLGLVPILTYITLILALPDVEFNKKIKSLVYGSITIFIANILRLVAVIWIGLNFGSKMFDFYHLIVLKYDLMVLVIALFAVSMAKLLNKNHKKR